MSRTALVLVDLQAAAFGGFEVPPVHDADRLIENVRALLRAARAAGVPVLHVQHCARSGGPFAEGAPGWPILSLVGPEGDESVVRKQTSNAFEGTDLHARLQAIGARDIVVAGIQTEHCVAATCHGALRGGYAVRLAADGHSTWPDGPRSADAIIVEEGAALRAAGVSVDPTERLVDWMRSTGERPAAGGGTTWRSG